MIVLFFSLVCSFSVSLISNFYYFYYFWVYSSFLSKIKGYFKEEPKFTDFKHESNTFPSEHSLLSLSL